MRSASVGLWLVLAGACTPSPTVTAGGPAATPSGCDARFSMSLTGIATDDIPGSDTGAVTAEEATARGVPCYAPGPHRDSNAARWCCKPGTPITFLGSCDPQFPRHLKNIQSVDDVPDGRGLANSAQDATARNLRCYAPGPHTAFNISHWCCK